MLNNTSKPTEVERKMATLSRRLTALASQVRSSKSVVELLGYRDSLQTMAATANNLRFVVAFNTLEETERATLSEDRLQTRLEAVMASCTELEDHVERTIDETIASRHANSFNPNSLHKVCASLGIGNHLSIKWSAISTAANAFSPILHVTAHGASDASGFKHDGYHIWVKPKGKGTEVSTSFSSMPPVEDWTDCASASNLLECLRGRFINDGF